MIRRNELEEVLQKFSNMLKSGRKGTTDSECINLKSLTAPSLPDSISVAVSLKYLARGMTSSPTLCPFVMEERSMDKKKKKGKLKIIYMQIY